MVSISSHCKTHLSPADFAFPLWPIIGMFFTPTELIIQCGLYSLCLFQREKKYGNVGFLFVTANYFFKEIKGRFTKWITSKIIQVSTVLI